MSNTSSEPITVEAINTALTRIDTLERAAQAWSRGDIKLWYRPITNLPSGWWPCDGTTAPDGQLTPDLRGRAPFGFTVADPAFDALGETGGVSAANLQHNHTGAAHDHTITHSHGVTGVTDIVSQTGGGGNLDLDTTVTLTHGGTDKVAKQQHTHNLGISGTASQTGTVSGVAVYSGNTGNALSTTQSILNPYCVVNFAYRWA